MQIAKILKLTEDEKHTMFDLAGEGKNTIAPDLPEYIMSSEKVRVTLRKAREVATEEDWDDFFKKLNENLKIILLKGHFMQIITGWNGMQISYHHVY